MNSIYEFLDYRKFIRTRFGEMPKKGYGQARRLAEFLNVHTTLISQVLGGLKDFSLEQAVSTAEFIGLSDIETEYFLLQVQLARAGSEQLKRVILRQLNSQKDKALELVNRLQAQKKLKDEERAIFYSDWSYAAIQQSTAIQGYNTLEPIADLLGLSKKRTREIIDFLLSTKLCIEENGKIKIGVQSTHLESNSPWVRIHHINWRQKAIEQMNSIEHGKLHYTCPMTLSAADALKIREMISVFLESMEKVVDPSPSEEIHCLNIDWFKIGK